MVPSIAYGFDGSRQRGRSRRRLAVFKTITVRGQAACLCTAREGDRTTDSTSTRNTGPPRTRPSRRLFPLWSGLCRNRRCKCVDYALMDWTEQILTRGGTRHFSPVVFAPTPPFAPAQSDIVKVSTSDARAALRSAKKQEIVSLPSPVSTRLPTGTAPASHIALSADDATLWCAAGPSILAYNVARLVHDVSSYQ